MSESSSQERRLNWKQACEILGCGKTCFYQMVKSGKLRAFSVGKRNLWVYEDDCFKLLGNAQRART